MDERKNVLSLCEQIIEGSERILQDSEKHEIMRRLANQINQRAKTIREICGVEKYNVYFHGTVGVGKTTAISVLSGLTDMESKSVGEFVLLKTSSGRTTPCETVIVPSEDGMDKILVESLTEEEFKSLLKLYCDSFFDRELKISEEEKRIFENMIGIKTKESSEMKLEEIKADMNVSEINKEALMEYAERKINYLERNHLEYILDGNKSESLKKIISDIITGKKVDCPYPKKITIRLSSNDLGFSISEYVKSIVDTKGIESPERKEINDVIEKVDTLTIICDKISSFGGSSDINSILKSSLIKENKDNANRVFYVGLSRGGEIQNVEGGDSEEEKKSIKKNEAVSKFAQDRINILESHIMFFNSFEGIQIIDNTNIHKVDEEVYKNNIKDFWDRVYEKINKMYLDYSDELAEILKRLNHLKSNKITDTVLEKFERVRSNVNIEKDNFQKSYLILDKLRGDLGIKHYSQIKAMVIRYGVYYNSNIYENIFRLGGEEFEQEMLTLKSKIIGQIQEIFSKNDIVEKICKETVEEYIDRLYESVFRKNQIYYHEQLLRLIHCDPAWKEQYNDYGSGYKDRVIGKTMEVIEEYGFKRSELYLKFFDEIDNFLKL